MITHCYCVSQPYGKYLLIVNSIILLVFLQFGVCYIISRSHSIHSHPSVHRSTSTIFSITTLPLTHPLINHPSIHLFFHIDSSIYIAHLYVYKLGQQTSMLLKMCKNSKYQHNTDAKGKNVPPNSQNAGKKWKGEKSINCSNNSSSLPADFMYDIFFGQFICTDF